MMVRLGIKNIMTKNPDILQILKFLYDFIWLFDTKLGMCYSSNSSCSYFMELHVTSF